MTLRDDLKVYYEAFPESYRYCDFCSKRFRTVAGLRNHALRMHPVETAPKVTDGEHSGSSVNLHGDGYGCDCDLVLGCNCDCLCHEWENTHDSD